MANNSRNNFLASFSPTDFGLEPYLEPVTLKLRKHLEGANERIDAVYFPEHGFVSVVAENEPDNCPKSYNKSDGGPRTRT